MGASFSMCNTMEDGLVHHVQEKDVADSSPKEVLQTEEAVVEAAAADVKAEAVSLAEDANSGTLVTKAEEANPISPAGAAGSSQEGAENTQSDKPAENGSAAAAAAAAAAAGAASEGGTEQIGLTGVTALVEAPPVQSLVVVFEKGRKQVEVKFEKRPLGFEVGEARKGQCCVAAPSGKFVVNKVANTDSKAVKAGMAIKKIGDQDVQAIKDLVDLREMLAQAEKSLPEA